MLEELFQCRLRESQRTDQSPNSWINNDGGDDDGNDGDDDGDDGDDDGDDNDDDDDDRPEDEN